MEQYSSEHIYAEVTKCELPNSFATDICNQNTTVLSVISIASKVEECVSNL